MIDTLRTMDIRVISLGIHVGIIQSMLDYDFLIGRERPSIVAIVAKGRNQERFFWGKDEISIKVYPELSSVAEATLNTTTIVINVQSARRVKHATLEAMAFLPKLKVISIFAEDTPELHSLQIRHIAIEKDILVVGPSSVGLLVPGSLKLGAIGGTLYHQLIEARISNPGNIAIITTSGGVVNELIRMVTSRGEGISFALAMGGDRFPITEPVDAMRLAQQDAQTARILYFGELGGTDEYEIAKLMKNKELTKPVTAYIAGKVAELFPTPPQFGHAKALAQTHDESAEAKKKALAEAGAMVYDSFEGVAASIGALTSDDIIVDESIQHRRKSYFMSHISGEVDGNVQLLGKNLTETVNENSVASLIISMILGEQITSKKLIKFVDYVLRLLADHSPNVSGAVNTMVAARAGKDLVSSLSAGLLTIGPRFGGAINAAAANWLEGANAATDPQQFVELITKRDGAISGIGHKKYRIDLPDPRVEALMAFSKPSNSKYVKFARSVEAITLTKKSNLILNVDGAIAAIMLDLLKSELHYSDEKLRQLVSIEFFNALFVLSRSIGFTAHYLDQRRNDEGLFRLDDDDLRYFTESE